MKKLYILLLLTFACSCESKKETAVIKEKKVVVTETKPRTSSHTIHLEKIGQLSASQTIAIRPRTAGTLQELFVQDGNFVKKGQKIYALDASEKLLALEKAKAHLSQIVIEEEALSKKHDRYKKLFLKELISEGEWEDVEKEYTVKKQERKKMELAVEEEKASLQKYTYFAPISGKLSIISNCAQELVTPETVLTTLSCIDRLFVDFFVTEKEMQQLEQSSKKVTVSSLIDPKKEIHAAISFVDTSFDPKSNRLMIRAALDNDAKTFLPGQKVRIQIPLKTLEEVIIVPKRCMKHVGEKTYLYTISDDDTVYMQQVEVGATFADEVIITNGLEVTKRIVREGQMRLYPGAKVAVQKSIEAE